MADESPPSDGKKSLFDLRHFVFQATKQAPGAIFGAISAALLALLGWYLTYSVPHLSYTVTPPVSFAGDKVQFGIVSVSIVNDGSKEAESVVCELELKGCSIRDIRVGPAVLEAKNTLDGGRATVKVQSLNPGETLQIAVETGDVNSLPESPKVSVRGKNTTGELRLPKSGNDTLTSRIISWVILCLVILMNIYAIFFDRRNKMIQQLTALITQQNQSLNNSTEAMQTQNTTIQHLRQRLAELTDGKGTPE
jgi:hypothetical protein